jgi:hypothetical protein
MESKLEKWNSISIDHTNAWQVNVEMSSNYWELLEILQCENTKYI